jgi:hypothetical protein
MKKALSLVEVLISVMLLSIIITTILQIKQNNLLFLEKFKQTSINNSYISLLVTSKTNNRNRNIYLSDKIDFNDDDIRQELKSVKINIKDEELDDIILPQNDYIKTAKVVKSTYTIVSDDNLPKNIYFTFKLQ